MTSLPPACQTFGKEHIFPSSNQERQPWRVNLPLEVVPDPVMVTAVSGDAQVLSLLGVSQGKGGCVCVCVCEVDLSPYLFQRIGVPPCFS